MDRQQQMDHAENVEEALERVATALAELRMPWRKLDESHFFNVQTGGMAYIRPGDGAVVLTHPAGEEPLTCDRGPARVLGAFLRDESLEVI